MPRSADFPIALITGASSGIGQTLAPLFAAAGHDLVLVARSTARLKALAESIMANYDVKVRVETADLARPGAAATLAFALKRKRVKIDLLVNNAGVLEQCAFTSMSPTALQGMIDLNITGLTAMLSHFVPPMVARGLGRVLNVASIAAFQPVPTLAAYAASTAYVLSLTESLSEELRGTGVSVTALCPGITATGMLSTASQANGKIGQIPDFLIDDVEDVARQAFKACMSGDVICVPGAVNRAAMLASRGTPRWLVRRVGGLIGRKAL